MTRFYNVYELPDGEQYIGLALDLREWAEQNAEWVFARYGHKTIYRIIVKPKET